MSATTRRWVYCAVALVFLGTACASAQSLELKRVQRPDTKVLPGSGGFVHPLTGVVYYTPQPWQQRPVLAVKIGNSNRERPQAGLDRADLVYEELVEGAETRFMAFFSTQAAPRVGPVRSVRTVDPKIMAPIGGLFGYSGGVPPIVNALRSTSGVTDVGANRQGVAYRRDGNRPMPYNLYTSTFSLWTGHTGVAPAAMFDFLRPSDNATVGGAGPAREVRFSFASNGIPVRYLYNPQTGWYGRYLGQVPHRVEGSTPGQLTQLAYRNVIVQIVRTTTGTTVDRAGARTHDVQVIGSGSALIFHGGRVFRGRWTRSSTGDRTHFTDLAGHPIRMAPGNSIVELLPQGQNVFVV